MDQSIPQDVPFSLVCECCDAGADIETFDEALAQGWTQITYAPETPMANYVGLCPDCRREEELSDQSRQEA